MSTLNLTVTVPPGDDRTLEITGPDGTVWTVRALGTTSATTTTPEDGDATAAWSAVDTILKRWTKFNPDTNAPAVMTKGNELGFSSMAPEPRKEGAAPPSYIRMVGKKEDGDRVTAFLNTQSLVVNSVAGRAAVKDLPGAVIRKNGDVAFALDVSICAKVFSALLSS